MFAKLSAEPSLIGHRLKKIRLDLDYTQMKFAHELGISQQNLSWYERGEGCISIPQLVALNCMGYAIQWILYGKGSMKNNGHENLQNNISKLENDNQRLKNKVQEIETERAELSKELIQRLSEIVELQKKLNNIMEKR